MKQKLKYIYRYNALSLLRRQLSWLGLKNWNGDVTKFEGVKIDQANSEQETALHLAVLQNNLTSVQTLLASGAGKEVENSMGQTALHLAAEHGNERLVRALLDKRANPDSVVKTGKSCLDISAVHNSSCAAVLSG